MQIAAKWPVSTLARRVGMALAVGLLLARPAEVAGQSPPAHPHLKNLGPTGLRDYMSDSYGTIGFGLVNPSGQDIETRILTFYAGADETVQPRHLVAGRIRSSRPGFPSVHAPIRHASLMELKSLLYDRSGKQNI